MVAVVHTAAAAAYRSHIPHHFLRHLNCNYTSFRWNAYYKQRAKCDMSAFE